MIFLLFILVSSMLIIDVIINVRIGKLHKHPYWSWMSACVFSIAMATFSIGGLILEPSLVILAILASSFSLLAAICGLLAQRKLMRSLQLPSVRAPKEEALISDEFMALKAHADVTNGFIRNVKEMLGAETIKSCLDKCIENHIILKGCEVGDGGLRVDAVARNIRKIKKSKQPPTIFRAFSSFNFELMDILSKAVSPEVARDVFLKTLTNSTKRYEIVYGQELPALLFWGVLEPFLIKCERKTTKKIRGEIEKLAKEEPMLREITIRDDGRIELNGIYKRLSLLQPGERERKTVSAFSKIMKTCIPLIRSDIGSRQADKISNSVFSSLIGDHLPYFLKRGLVHPILKAMPGEVKIPDILGSEVSLR